MEMNIFEEMSLEPLPRPISLLYFALYDLLWLFARVATSATVAPFTLFWLIDFADDNQQ